MGVFETFSTFNRDFVNLDPERTRRARSSRDWLYGRLNQLPQKSDSFPFLYPERHIKFGSFARNTKIRELDDVDLMLTFGAQNAYYVKSQIDSKKYYINTENSGPRLSSLSDNNLLNSIKVVNQVVKGLSQVEHYRQADIHRRQEAATLQLASYEWNFDIVPAFYTVTDFYLIPDGNGAWKATNPQIDHNRVNDINNRHNKRILQIIRTLKYWNRRAAIPTIPSYLFETMILNYFNTADSSFLIDFNLRDFWNHLSSAVFASVWDPKGYDGDLNCLSYDERLKVSLGATRAYQNANIAIQQEMFDLDTAGAISTWAKIFGGDFR